MQHSYCVRYHTSVSKFTEDKIEKLCSEAISVKNEGDVERVVPELRSALEEHIRLAKESLTDQAQVISTIVRNEESGAA
jgi:hypothetical protein